MEDLDCAKAIAVRIMAELDSKKRIGLIEKKGQGSGKPDIIYMKNFAVVEEQEGVVYNGVGVCVATEVQDLNLKKYKSKNSSDTEDGTAMVQRLNGNYNKNSYMEKDVNSQNIVAKLGDEVIQEIIIKQEILNRLFILLIWMLLNLRTIKS